MMLTKKLSYRIFDKLVKAFTVLAAIPVAIVIIAISPWLHIRLIRLFSYRIGHFAINTELLINKAQQEANKNCFIYYYLTADHPISNFQLLKMWKRVIPILPCSSFWDKVDRIIMKFGIDKFQNDPLRVFSQSEGYKDKNYDLDKYTTPKVSFSVDERKQGEMILRTYGIDPHQKFVCLMLRDSNYLSTYLPSHDWSYHDYRDVDVSNYYEAAKYLAEHGYNVFRMGKYPLYKFNLSHPNIFDYANSSFHSDFMDIYLSANCDFMISTSTGLDAVAQLFRRPILITDFPLSDFESWYYWKLFIPKMIFDEVRNQYFTFKEMYSLSSFNRQKIIEICNYNNWRLINNSPDEIVEAVKEMLDILSSNYSEPDESMLLQTKFWQNLNVELPNGISHYSHLNMRISSFYLQRYKELI